MSPGEGPGWHRESRRHHDAAMQGRRPTSGHGPHKAKGEFTEVQKDGLLEHIQFRIDLKLKDREAYYDRLKADGYTIQKIYKNKIYLEYAKDIQKWTDYKNQIKNHGPEPLTAKEILFAEYGTSKNMMTPNTVKVGKLSPTIAYELSSGLGINYKPIYGVSIVHIDVHGKPWRNHEASMKFDSLEAAKCHIDNFKGSR